MLTLLRALEAAELSELSGPARSFGAGLVLRANPEVVATMLEWSGHLADRRTGSADTLRRVAELAELVAVTTGDALRPDLDPVDRAERMRVAVSVLPRVGLVARALAQRGGSC